MKNSNKKLLTEMAIIVLLAVAIGIACNYRLLRDVSAGRIPGATQTPATSATPSAILIPAGLAQVKELFDKKEALFVDARESSVFALGHIQGATSLPLAEIDSSLADFKNKVPAGTTLVLYCGGYGCHDSKNLGEKLLQSGYRQVLIFEGGYPEWKDAGYPISGAIQ